MQGKSGRVIGRDGERRREGRGRKGEEEGDRFYTLKIRLSWPMVNEWSHCANGEQ